MRQDQQNPLWKLNKASVLLDAMDAAARAHDEAARLSQRRARQGKQVFPITRPLNPLIWAGSTAIGAMAMLWLLV